MKKFKKVCSLGLALMMCMAGSAAVPACYVSAADNGNEAISPQNIAIVQTYNNLEVSSSGVLTCQSTTSVRSGYYAEVIVELQKYNDGWKTIEVWSCVDSDYASVYENYSVNKEGASYRLKLTHTSYDHDWNRVESFNKYSKVVTY